MFLILQCLQRFHATLLCYLHLLHYKLTIHQIDGLISEWQTARLFNLWTESLFQTGDRHLQELCVQLRNKNNYYELDNHMSIQFSAE